MITVITLLHIVYVLLDISDIVCYSHAHKQSLLSIVCFLNDIVCVLCDKSKLIMCCS